MRRRDPRTMAILGLLMALVASVWAFAHVAEDYLTGDPLVQWDTSFALWLHERTSDPVVSLFKVVTLAGNGAVLVLVVTGIALLFWRRGWRNDSAALVFAFSGAALLNAALKLAFHRPRPEVAVVQLDTYSFPSGHAAVSGATFATLAFLLCRRERRLPARAVISLGALLGIALVGFSRLYLGVHYLSDVLAGVSLGIAWAACCAIVYTFYGESDPLRRLPGWREERRSS